MNKKILMSLLLVFIVALSVSAASAADDAADVIADADDAVVAEVDDTVLADEAITPGQTGDDVKDIQTAIDSAAEGGTVDLGDRTYDVRYSQINITKKITVSGNATVKGMGGNEANSGAIFYVKDAASNAVISGIKFINTNPSVEDHPYGTDSLHGWGIAVDGVHNVLIDNCMFIFFNQGVNVYGANNLTISNSYFNGTATSVTNGGKKESGTKAISAKQANALNVINNTFDGNVLDGVSLASGSTNNMVIGNTFNNNCYAIYFGGASSSKMDNNTFNNCGHFESPDGTVIFNNLPIISMQKAASDFSASGNKFIMGDGVLAMKFESGNTAHGYPSAIGNDNITNNEIELRSDVDPATITFIAILSNEGQLSPYAPLNFSDNTIPAGVTAVSYWTADYGDENGNVYIDAADPVQTTINAVVISSSENKIVVELREFNGTIMDNTPISYTINGGAEVSTTTDDNGQFILENLTGSSVVAFNFAGGKYGNYNYAPSSTEVQFVATELGTTQLSSSSATVTAIPNSGSKTYNLAVTLKDAAGNAIANKDILVFINGAQKTAKTDANGVAKIAIAYSTATTYKVNMVFAGDKEYLSSTVTSTLTVKKNPTTITAKTKKVKKSQAKKAKVKFLFKSGGVVLKKAKVTLKINGKTYKATTNAKGIATFKVKLAKKAKTYKYTAKFAGNGRSAAKTLKKSLKVA